MFALGLMSWLYGRPIEGTMSFLEAKFGKRPEIAKANMTAFQAGWNFGETTEDFAVRYEVKPALIAAGHVPEHHRQPRALLRPDRGGAARRAAAVPRLVPDHPGLGHPARAVQAQEVRRAHLPGRGRDRAASAALGAAFGGSLAVTTTSGPGMLLKAETVGLAVSWSCRCVVVDVQRAGPSTGMPTKTEQADLLMALFGRNGESPVPVVAAASPSDCFFAAIEAARIALTYRTPVILLSDGYLANGSEPWRIPDVDSLPDMSAAFAFATAADKPETATSCRSPRDPQTLARPWAVPGTPGLEHRIGGIEKADGTGNISYDPDNHDLMVRTRAAKVEGIAASIPPLEVDDPTGDAKVLVLGWGSTYGPIGAAVRRARRAGRDGRAGAPAPPQPVPRATSARCCAATTRCWSRR